MRQLMMMIALAASCGGPSGSQPVPRAVPPPPLPVEAPASAVVAPTSPPTSPPASRPPTPPSLDPEIVTELTVPVFGKPAAIFHVDDEIAVTLDEAGLARHTGNSLFVGQTDRWIPFSEPVSDVVFVRRVVHPRNVPGAQSARMFCARTRTASLECVADFEPTPKAPRLVRRFRLPVTGGVEHLGVAALWRGAAPEGVVCVDGASATCWLFDWAGARATPFDVDPAIAEAAALRIDLKVQAAWSKAVPSLNAARIREVVRTEPRDTERILGRDANIAVHCARLDGGELSCFGPGVYGELGDGKLALAARASRPLGDAVVVDVAVLGHRVCAVVADGRVACWGKLSGDLPVPRTHQPTRLPACPLDRTASTAKFHAERTAAVQRAKECRRTCEGNRRDACMSCTIGCIPTPYLFRHDTICQEPVFLDGTLAAKEMKCFDASTPPRWLTDAELRADTPAADLTLSPVYLTGITDAIGVALPGRPSLCVLRRGGKIACLDQHGQLAR